MVAMMLRASIGRDPTYVWVNRHRKSDSEGAGALGNLTRDPTYAWINRHHKSESEGSGALDKLTGDPTYAWINRHRKNWQVITAREYWVRSRLSKCKWTILEE